MRELRVIGVTPDSAHIVCVDTENGQKFRLPADDKLRAAARGDLARFGQIEIETEATMRPRDIQARIRAGASVEQVTAESGLPANRVERFAYPVLLERARAAELAQKAHPIRSDGPAAEILLDVVTAAFTARGHTLENAEWDAWKDEKGFWVAQLQWRNGHSEIAAHWRYQPDAHGGTVSPLDDPAADLIDPDFGRALRGLATILPSEPETPPEPAPAVEVRREVAPAPRSAPVSRAAEQYPAVGGYYEQRAVAAGGSTVPATGGGAAVTSNPTASTDTRAESSGRPTESAAASGGRSAKSAESAEPQTAGPEDESATAPEQPAKPANKTKPASRGKRGKAPMPSWEDVLLGVRGPGR
ncbi:septation protein SepH [Nocardia paucivorans]|uniref:septation protein SepH n=1 Tax=Nocardia paucivorans TaxID=114259 RepID=UPI00030C5967|nr:septation protein SepH [Nocardia paucivorans]